MFIRIQELKEKTGLPLRLCSQAYAYAPGNKKMQLAYLLVKSIADAAQHMTFEEQVQLFYRSIVGGE